MVDVACFWPAIDGSESERPLSSHVQSLAFFARCFRSPPPTGTAYHTGLPRHRQSIFGKCNSSLCFESTSEEWQHLTLNPNQDLLNLRRRNTEYKNPKLVTQHCCVSSFWSMFLVFHLAGSTCRTTKTFVAG